MILSRAEVYRKTRDVGFIWRVCLVIVLAGILLAGVVRTLQPSSGPVIQIEMLSAREEWRLDMKSRVVELMHSVSPQPGLLADWLREMSGGLDASGPGWEFNRETWSIDDIRLKPLINKNTVDDAQAVLFTDYALGLFLDAGDTQASAMQRVHEAALKDPATPFASGFDGDFLFKTGKLKDALTAYMREGRRDESRKARARAFSIALELQDSEALRELCSDPRYLREVGSGQMASAARITGDWWLLLCSVLKLQWARWSQTLAMPLALLAAGVWYLLLVYTGSSERWRWLRYLSSVFAGVISVWVLDFLMETYRYGINLEDQKTAGHEIIQWVFYVGIPEETVKLGLFAVFLPLLLRYASASKAALTAGCVGLGFAFEENLGYYLHQGGVTAIGRFITANFLHVALTGITGSALYDMVRSRFHRAGDFLVAYTGACVAHGVYDYSGSESAQMMGIDIAGVIVLAVMARIYLGKLKPADAELRRRTLSSTFIFCVGSALLVAATIMVTVWQMESMSGATTALRSVVGVFPIALLYVREFREI